MLTRREFLRGSAASPDLILGTSGCTWRLFAPAPTLVNDLHSQLNPTRIDRRVRAESLENLVQVIQTARIERKGISIAAGRHAMGGQQFGTDTLLIDMRRMNRVLRFDREKGEIEVEAGTEWPELVNYLLGAQHGQRHQWGIIQKQTGADRLSLGGALAANIHGRGLHFKPFIGDVESFVLVDANGRSRQCSRQENSELFRLAIGGYGLFGVIASITLRLAPRRKMERVVTLIEIEDLMPAFEKRMADGFLYGDFQYATDMNSDDFLRKGVFSCYRPVQEDLPIPEEPRPPDP